MILRSVKLISVKLFKCLMVVFTSSKLMHQGRCKLCLDGRGKSTPGNKVDITEVVNHIKSFPAYSNHYTRARNPNRKFLNPDLTIKKMYDRMYCGVKKITKLQLKKKCITTFFRQSVICTSNLHRYLSSVR